MRKCFVLLLAVVIVLSLCACGVEPDDIIGTWNASWEYDGHTFENTIIFLTSNKFIEELSRDGASPTMYSGTYECDGGKVLCRRTGEPGTYEYKYRNRTLDNGGNKYKKIG